ncbi:RING/FYVE/PHD zinc finger superfamily protein isoform 3 [Hibiscus syriacus]|uniref:RING/FYVE/PHD zinc finger superfamily protein isoform 3 n=1 Tax=Hibiscus syriacus TaxID=106335 RepID=A0A6A3ASV5_HIBSY|nr:RING/FYVE/PHD zinc finger superfamily protein isoform 3 [Hibiscus syriacus]
MSDHLVMNVDGLVKPEPVEYHAVPSEENPGPSRLSDSKEKEVRQPQGILCFSFALQPYQPDYTAVPRTQTEETTIDIGGVWTISGTPLDLRDPRLLAIAEAERQFLETEYGEYAVSNASGAAFALMALLLLRHALNVPDADSDDDVYCLHYLLDSCGCISLPCYIMAWAITMFQRRKQRQEAAAASTQVAFVLQSGQHRGMHFTIASGTTVTPQ